MRYYHTSKKVVTVHAHDLYSDPSKYFNDLFSNRLGSPAAHAVARYLNGDLEAGSDITPAELEILMSYLSWSFMSGMEMAKNFVAVNLNDGKVLVALSGASLAGLLE